MFHQFGISKSRKERGILAPLAFGALIVAGFVVGALGVDMAHMVYVQNELQTATDAAALSGAQGLAEGPDVAEKRAYSVCGMNRANGKAISEPDAKVTVAVNSSLSGSSSEVTVVAEMNVEHLLARIIGRNGDIVLATSTAGAGGTTKTLSGDQAFPLAVSLDAGNGPGQPIKDYGIGDDITITLWNQQQATAGFTTFGDDSVAHEFDLMQPACAKPKEDDGSPPGNSGGNNNGGGNGDTGDNGMNYIRNAMDQALGISPVVPGFRPTVKVGDFIYLKNGQAGAVHLNNDNRQSIIVGKTLILPVILGRAQYNNSRQVKGFISLEVTGVDIGQNRVTSFSGTLVESIVKGRSTSVPRLITSSSYTSTK
jgi:Flp pilus assembly protein TadG